MINRLVNSTNNLEKGLDSAWLRNQVIANNIANVDTPNFKASRVEFESAFKQALENDASSFKSKRTSDKHMQLGFGDASSIYPTVVPDDTTTMRMDGNNVDIDKEMAEQTQNNLYYYTLVRQISKEFSRLKLAISEGK